jgi:hypothetical protein
MATKIGQAAAELTATNPWWRSPGAWAKNDPDLRAAAASGLDYEPLALRALQPGGLYLLRGPRRVGKTVAMKQAINRLLLSGQPPLSIVRIAADGWTASELRTVVQNVPLPPAPEGGQRWWFIDEVTAVTGDWATQVKWLRDNDAGFGAATVVLTGSSAASLTAGAGVLAGRRGRVPDVDRTLMPMGFRTFVAVWEPDLLTLPVLATHEIHSAGSATAYQQAHLWLSELVPLWELYLGFGGFPASVAAAKAGQPIPRWFTDAMFDVIHRDAFAASGLDESTTAALVARIWRSTSAPLNLRNVGDDLGLAHTTVARHVEYLRDAYLLWNCPQLDKEWVGRERSQDKVYPIDPLVGRLAHLRSGNRADLDLTELTESQIGMVLRRATLASGGTWTDDRPLYYLRTATRKEVDFVGESLGGAAVEGKYVEGGTWAREAATVQASGYRGILTTRNVLNLDGGPGGAWAVPASVLAVLLDT